jgi:hydroxymethylpyrimidine pyrophosphatase-like HAD family hydrolase
MTLPIKLISTDFDGTLYAGENPPVPVRLQRLIAYFQSHGAKWIINTGRDLSSLMETLGRAHLAVKPDYLVLVEREIYCHHDSQYVELADWNSRCTRAHGEVFTRVRQDLPRLVDWVQKRYAATIYEDAFSPFCLIAESYADADAIHRFLEMYCDEVPHLSVVRNDVYIRFSHGAFNKGTALCEVARLLGVSREHVLAAGDHWNDVPMLSEQCARWLVAPANAIDPVKELVLRQNGYVSRFNCGDGVADGLIRSLRENGIDWREK